MQGWPSLSIALPNYYAVVVAVVVAAVVVAAVVVVVASFCLSLFLSHSLSFFHVCRVVDTLSSRS